MCSSKTKLQETTTATTINNVVVVLHHHHHQQQQQQQQQQPLPNNCCINRAPLLERRNSINCPSPAAVAAVGVIHDHRLNKSKSFNHSTQLSSSSSSSAAAINNRSSSFRYTSSAIVEAPGTIAAARREQVAIFQEQRKLRIAHYGRTTSNAKTTTAATTTTASSNSNFTSNHMPPSPATNALPDHINSNDHHEKRCTFITPNSDPVYVAYHDEEWGVPVHDDRMLFELLVLTGAQVGSDWTSVLKRRRDFRDAFLGFDAETVSKLTEKKMSWISAEYNIEMSLVRGVVDNSKRILEVKRECGSFAKYLWGFVNHKAIETRYKWSQKIPAKTSKSEAISKDMVRRGFRQVGPTVVHSFMQAAGLTNDHLLTCPRHAAIILMHSSSPVDALIANN